MDLLNQDVTLDGVHLHSLTLTFNTSTYGDSGAPTYHKTGANGAKAIYHGVLSGGNGVVSALSPFGNAAQALGVHF